MSSAVQVVTLPLLLKIFTKDQYGLIVIALSLNAFVTILQLGLPTGLPKFVAEWLRNKASSQLLSAARTVTSIYFMVALTSAVILLFLAYFKIQIFQVDAGNTGTLQALLVVTAITSLASIPVSIIDQLLSGAQEFGLLASIETISSLALAGVVLLLHWNVIAMNLVTFYLIRCSLTFVGVPFKLRRWRRYGSAFAIIPGWSPTAVTPVIRFCSAVMAFAAFGLAAEAFRPMIVGVRVLGNAGRELADYQIINSVRLFLLMIVSSMMATMVPYISSSAAGGNSQIYRLAITVGTKYVWAFGALLGFGVIMLAPVLLTLYVGQENAYLSTWLIVITSAAMYNLYITPIVSVILASGKLMPMIFATGTGCIASLVCCWALTPLCGMGSIPISLVVYNTAHMAVTHFWYLPRYFDVHAWQQYTQVMFPPIAAGLLMLIGVKYALLAADLTNKYTASVVAGILGTVIYTSFILVFYIKPNEISALLRKIRQ